MISAVIPSMRPVLCALPVVTMTGGVGLKVDHLVADQVICCEPLHNAHYATCNRRMRALFLTATLSKKP